MKGSPIVCLPPVRFVTILSSIVQEIVTRKGNRNGARVQALPLRPVADDGLHSNARQLTAGGNVPISGFAAEEFRCHRRDISYGYSQSQTLASRYAPFGGACKHHVTA